jgi:hypothetical protein
MSRRSKNPLLIDHARREPSSMIMNAELSAVKISVPSMVITIGMKNVRQYMALPKFVIIN